MNKKYGTLLPFLFYFFSFTYSLLLCISCSSMVQKGGELLEGSAFAEMELALYRSGKERTGTGKKKIVEIKELRLEDGRQALEITSSEWPGLALRGGMPGGSGNFVLHEARILSSHVHGWNEFTLDIIGRAVFDNPRKTGGVLFVNDDAERITIKSGKIRLKSSRITGDAALARLANRRERVLALIEWMAGEQENEKEVPVFASQKEFEKYWKPRLFPELVSKRKRPPEYSKGNAEWKRADSVRWNTSYTKSVFAEGLWEYRDSGALLRDWEEALTWIYIEYSWGYILNSFNNIAMHKTK